MIRVYRDLDSLSRAAAELFVQLARAAVGTRGRFTVALAGGNTPERAYELLAGPPFRDRVEWENVHIFWGDERCVPPEDPRNNARMAYRALLRHVPVPAARIHPIVCAGNPTDVASEYDLLLRSFFGDAPSTFDLVFLGLGENGHTASLFPGDAALYEKERWAAAVSPAEQEISRVTLTPTLINRASAVAFLVSGPAKAEVLRKALDEHHDPMDLPALLIQPELHGGQLYWLADRAAASLLEGPYPREDAP